MPKQPKSAANDNKQLLPVDILRKMKVDGDIAIGALKMSGLALNNLKITVKGDNGVINADPVTASLYDGTLNTAVKIDARGASPVFTINGALKNLQAGKLIAAKMGQDYVTGLANLDFDLNSRGNTMGALKSASGGKFAFSFGEGYINKWQLSRLINQAIAFFETGTVSQDAGDRIHFTSLDGSFTGSNGVFSNNDLQLLAPKSHALGSGTVSLRDQNVDYSLRVGLGENPATFADKKHLPILISGPLSAPQYSIDFQSIIREEAQKQIEEKGQELLNKALGVKEEGSAPADNKGTIDPAAAGEMLKGLFGGN
jgi:AsmA protein